jgi:hypothetical protein
MARPPSTTSIAAAPVLARRINAVQAAARPNVAAYQHGSGDRHVRDPVADPVAETFQQTEDDERDAGQHRQRDSERERCGEQPRHSEQVRARVGGGARPSGPG